MIETRTPFRISFLGGSMGDGPEGEQAGAMLATTIDKYVFVRIRPLPAFSSPPYVITVSGHRETAHTIEDIRHPTVRACFQHLDVTEAVELELETDLPAGTGIGSRCSCTVGILHAILVFRKQRVSKSSLAEIAIEIEQEILKEGLGCQDQTITAYGGLNILWFSGKRGRDINLEPVAVDEVRAQLLVDRLMLFYLGSGGSKKNPEIGSRTELRPLQQPDLADLNQLLLTAVETINHGSDLDAFGRLLHDGWELDRRWRDEILPASVDRMYEKALDAGALGGRFLGSRGMGFALFYAPPECREAVRRALKLHLVPFGLDRCGTKLLNR